ncbi:MAG: DUF3489 domain-containing protein [Magnetococcales bacterium]|nr:DUF3489 domain-containing protein [Magnetococcales bacterium]
MTKMTDHSLDAGTPKQAITSDWAARSCIPAKVTTIAAHQPLLDIAERYINVTQSNWAFILPALEEAYALGMVDILRRKPNPALRAVIKEEVMFALMKHPEGATITQLAEVTGWRSPTIRKIIADLGGKPMNPDAPQDDHTAYRIEA